MSAAVAVRPCPHGMPTPGSCIDCHDEVGFGPDPEVATETAAGPEFVIERKFWRYPCKLCSDRIVEGDCVVRTNRDRVVHVGCL